MARKNVTASFRLYSAQSLATSFESAATNVKYLDNLMYLLKTTGVTDNTGSFGVEVRMTQENSPTVVSDWVALTLAATPTLADTDFEHVINLGSLCFDEIRLTFTAAGGTPDGTVEVWVRGNQVGG